MNNLFPVFQFHMDEYSNPHELSMDRNGDRTKTFTKHHFIDYVKGICVEINFRKSKFLLSQVCHLPPDLLK